MRSVLRPELQKSQTSGPYAPCALWPVELKLTHLDWNPEATLIHFQGQYLTICELDYNILQGEIQNIPKTKAAVDVGEVCLVEDLTSARWYRGRVQNQKEDLFDVFLIDHGNVLSVGINNISSCSDDLFILPPKIVSGFLANVLLLHGSFHSVMEDYLSNLVGRNVTGYIQALLPHKVLLLEAPDINMDLVRHGFGRHVDTNTFLLLVEMLTEVPLKQNIEPVPDLLIEKPRDQEFCFEPSGLQGYEAILSFWGPRLSCGTHAKVRITAAVNPGLFYCQLASMETDLWEISKKLAAVCEYRTKEHTQQSSENLGLLCAVKCKDGKWYRGLVQFLPVNSQVRVLLIDYGFFESVKVENVHRLPPVFDSTPIMAFPCSLFSVNDQDEVVRTQQLGFLKAGLLGRVLDIEVKRFDEEQHLYSVTLNGAEDNHINKPEPLQEPPKEKVESIFETGMSPQGGYLYYERIVGKEMCETMETEEVLVDSVFVGYVEHVLNPNHFWIRTQKRNGDFDEMMTQMADHFSQVKLDEDVLLNPELGTLCCAVYEEDMHFYRAVVTDIFEHGAEVLFIDFGNIKKVPHMLIKKIPEIFTSKSAFAFCCALVNVFPLDEVWNTTASDFFRKAVSNKAMLVHVVQKRKNTFVVDLYEMGSDNCQSITELLVSSKQAEYFNRIPTEPRKQTNTTVKERTRRPRFSVAPDISQNAEQVDDCEEGRNICRNDIQKPQAPARFKALTIKPGYDFAVRCSYINSPSDFWCQPQDKVPALEELMDKVQQYYSTHSVPLKSGDLCCVAKSPQDARWNRALITEKRKGHASVMLVDRGCINEIREHNLQTIMPEYICLERQAFRCSLYNLIEPADPKNCGDWSPEVCKVLKDFVFNSTSDLRCKVVSQLNVKNKGLCNVVDLYNTKTQQSVTKLLLEQGLARKATVSTKQWSTVFPETFVFSSYDLSPGNEEQVYVTHVSSQWEVYCHLERNSFVIEELEKKILEESEKMIHASTSAVVRKLCLAKYLDGKWYRAVAHSVQSPLHLSVFFVDYGNGNISEKTQVMFIPRDSTELLYTPMQALRFSLASVSNEVLYADVKEWIDGAVLNKQLRAVIVGKNEDGSFDVELFDGDVKINEKVKELILSLSPKPETDLSCDISSTKTTKTTDTSVWCQSRHKGHSTKSPTLNPHRENQRGPVCKRKENTKNYVYGKPQNMCTKVKQNEENSTKSCATIKPQNNSQVKQQSESCDMNRKSEQPQCTEETEIPQLSCLPDIKVSEGFRAGCFVSHIDSVHSFFLQLSEDEPAILKMVEDLNSDFLRDSMKTATSWKISDLVLAEYDEDGALYRSAVKDYEGNSCVKVEFVDYGNSAVVGKEKIYSIPKEYLSQPRFSIPCSLLDTSMYKNDASFIAAVTDKPLMVDFACHFGTHWEVKIEILDGNVALPVALEAAVESNTETEKKGASPSSSEIEDKVRSCEVKMSENETIQPKSMVPTVDGEIFMLKPPPLTRSPKLKVITFRRRRGMPTRSSGDSKKNRRKTAKSSIKAKNALTEAIANATIQAKDTENGTVLLVLRNCDFYVRLNKVSELLAALECYIADNLYKYKTVAEEDVKHGLKCLVQLHKGEQWYRAVVQHTSQDRCQVLLVDHGISKEIPSASIRQQCCGLEKIPNLAVLCKMNEGEGSHNLWYETLKPMIGREVKLVFVCYLEVDNIWKVEIVVNGQLLIHPIRTSLQQNEEMDPSPAETQSKKAEGKPRLYTIQPQQLVFAPVDMDKEYFGFAAAVTTPSEFCVVLEDLLLSMYDVSIMLHNLPGHMSSLPESHIVPGTCCLFKSETKNKWCRAEIIHVDNTVVLNLVDYGHYECMPYENCSNLKRLSEEVMSLPKVTYPCILRGVKPVEVDGQWTDEATVFFQQCLYQKNLQIFFREFVSNTHWKVDILANGVHVSKELVDAGHATYIDIMLGLRFQEQRPCETAPCSSDSEEECGQEDEVCNVKSDVSVEPTDEAEEKEQLSTESGPRQCCLM